MEPILAEDLVLTRWYRSFKDISIYSKWECIFQLQYSLQPTEGQRKFFLVELNADVGIQIRFYKSHRLLSKQ